MLDTWKDWTGARYIYMYLPDDLGLRRITFYHRQLPDDLDLFMYLVLVECHGITNKDKQVSIINLLKRNFFKVSKRLIGLFYYFSDPLIGFRPKNEA